MQVCLGTHQILHVCAFVSGGGSAVTLPSSSYCGRRSRPPSRWHRSPPRLCWLCAVRQVGVPRAALTQTLDVARAAAAGLPSPNRAQVWNDRRSNYANNIPRWCAGARAAGYVRRGLDVRLQVRARHVDVAARRRLDGIRGAPLTRARTRGEGDHKAHRVLCVQLGWAAGTITFLNDFEGGAVVTQRLRAHAVSTVALACSNWAVCGGAPRCIRTRSGAAVGSARAVSAARGGPSGGSRGVRGALLAGAGHQKASVRVVVHTGGRDGPWGRNSDAVRLRWLHRPPERARHGRYHLAAR